MKKNKQLDKVVDQSLRSAIKGDKLDESKVKSTITEFKKMTLTDSIYALNTFKKGLSKFIEKHTLTIYSPVELPGAIITKIKNSLGSEYSVQNTASEIDSSLLAGFKFKIGDTIFDSSLRSSLESLAK